jgi:hypothetical protein
MLSYYLFYIVINKEISKSKISLILFKVFFYIIPTIQTTERHINTTAKSIV